MKKFSLILIVSTFIASAVYAGNIPMYEGSSDMFSPGYNPSQRLEQQQRQWEDEQRLRRLENQQRQLEERFNRKEPEPLLWPSSKPGDSLFK